MPLAKATERPGCLGFFPNDTAPVPDKLVNHAGVSDTVPEIVKLPEVTGAGPGWGEGGDGTGVGVDADWGMGRDGATI